MDAKRLREIVAVLIGLGSAAIEASEALIRHGEQLTVLSDELLKMAEPKLPDEDVLYLAKAIQGEGAGLFDNRHEVGLWIAHTALNRTEKPWWPDSVAQVVREAFHGHVNVGQPKDWALELAREALAREGDIADGALFMLSGADLIRHDWSSDGEIKRFMERRARLHFFRLWPGD